MSTSMVHFNQNGNIDFFFFFRFKGRMFDILRKNRRHHKTAQHQEKFHKLS